MRLELITAEGDETRHLRERELIRFPQLTMPLLAALAPSDFEIHHTDEIVEPVDFSRSTDLAAITANTPAAPHAYALADEFRARGIPVVLGGPHPTLMPHEAKTHADAVVVGEAETTWPQLLADFQRGQMRPFYRAERPPSLSGLPVARRDLLPGRWYGTGVVIATRGCPNVCDYCTLPHIYHRQMRFRPLDEVEADVASIRGKALIFWDDNIGADRAYAKALFQRLAPYRKWWTSQATVHVADDEEFLRLAADSGCKALFVGLESVSQPSLEGTGKGFNQVNRYRDLVERFHAHGIALQAGIMFGFDGDDRSIFGRTVDFMDAIGVDNATISLVVPFPGTTLFRRLESEGRILTRDWSKYNGKTDVVFRPARMAPDELMAGFQWAKRQFYSWGSIIRRLGVSRTGLWWNVPRNVGYKRAVDAEGRRGYDPAQPRPVSSRYSPTT